MFTGLIQARVPVASFEPVGTGARLVLEPPDSKNLEATLDGAPWDPRLGESIAVAGVCLTVVEFQDPATGRPLAPGDPAARTARLAFDLSKETLDRSWFGDLTPGRVVNLERSLRLGDRLGGHQVTGHVDGLGRVLEIADPGDGGRNFTFEVEGGFERYLVEKGSVAVDGISLTVVVPDANRFQVAVIPATLELTNLGSAAVGQRVNLEADPTGKWIEHLLEPYLARLRALEQG